MSENNENSSTPEGADGSAGAGNGNGAASPEGQPSMVMLAQYLKDLSFESPKAPHSFSSTVSPEIDVNVDVNGGPLGENRYEVEFSVSAKASRGEESVFIVEATYAGAFEIKNLSREQLEVALLVECPRLLFPFMRQIIAEATRNGNFPPIMLDPIDFMGIYLANKGQMQQQQQPAGQA